MMCEHEKSTYCTCMSILVSHYIVQLAYGNSFAIIFVKLGYICVVGSQS